MSLGFLGRFVEASARSDNALRIAERTEHPFQLVWASFGIATLAFLKGQMMDVAIPVLERRKLSSEMRQSASEICEQLS